MTDEPEQAPDAGGFEATLADWRASGSARLDPVRFRLIEAMVRRAAAHGSAVRARLDARIGVLVAGYGAAFDERSAARDAAGSTGAPTASPGGKPTAPVASASNADSAPSNALTARTHGVLHPLGLVAPRASPASPAPTATAGSPAPTATAGSPAPTAPAAPSASLTPAISAARSAPLAPSASPTSTASTASRPPRAPAAPFTPPAPSGARGPLGELAGHLTAQRAAAAPPAAEAALPGTAAEPEIASLAYFRATWSRLNANRRVTQSLATVPENAGPLNSHQLMHRSLSLMRELSPGYLNHFMGYVDALMWLEQSDLSRTAPTGAKEAKASPGRPSSRRRDS